MTRSTNMEHVEVLRDLSEVCRAAIKAGDWKVDGACDPDAVLRRADAAIASLSAPKSRDAESKLAEAGVFAGHHGLRGLADADEFWEAQPYGTRLYYGDGGMDYLHRGVLKTAVEILDAAPQPPAEAQPVGKVSKDTGLTVTLERLPYYTGTRLAKGTELYAHPPPSAPVGVDVGDKDCLTTRARELLADEYRKRGIGTGLVNDAGTATNVAIAAIATALTQQPAAVDGWRLVVHQSERDTKPAVWATDGDSFVWVADLAAQQGGGK